MKFALTSLRVDSKASCRAFTKSFLLGRLCGTKSPSCDLKNNSKAQYSTQCASICLCGYPGQKQCPQDSGVIVPTVLSRLLIKQQGDRVIGGSQSALHSLAKQLFSIKLSL